MLHFTQITGEPWNMIGVDLMGPYRVGSESCLIFTATDYFTKWCEASVIENKQAPTVAKQIVRLFYRHGPARVMLTDNGKEFKNKKVSNKCKWCKYQKILFMMGWLIYAESSFRKELFNCKM